MEGKEQKDKNLEVKVSEEDRDGLKVRGDLVGGIKTKWTFPNCSVSGCVEETRVNFRKCLTQCK